MKKTHLLAALISRALMFLNIIPAKAATIDWSTVCRANSYPGCYGQLVKAAAMIFPVEPTEVGAADERFTGNF